MDNNDVGSVVKNVNVLQERAQKYDFNMTNNHNTPYSDNIYIERSNNLKQFSIPKFHQWRMKYHYKTLMQYVHSKEDQQHQIKKDVYSNTLK